MVFAAVVVVVAVVVAVVGWLLFLLLLVFCCWLAVVEQIRNPISHLERVRIRTILISFFLHGQFGSASSRGQKASTPVVETSSSSQQQEQ